MALKRGSKQLLAEASRTIETITVQEALRLVGDPGAVFVDIRDKLELERSGTIEGAVHAPRGHLEFHADPESPRHVPALSSGKRIVLFCASGARSTLAAKTLADMGLENVCHMAGGFEAWTQAGGPVQR
jgi:rhodanese-related sulfurtransferase